MFNKDANVNIIDHYTDYNGRRILVNVNIDGDIYSIANLYCPNEVNDRITFLKDTTIWISSVKATDDKVFVMGDINCVDDPSDRASNRMDKSAEYYKTLKTELQLTDIWKDLNDKDKGYTFIDPSLNGRNSRIDVILSSNSLIHFAKSISTLPAPVPDHKAVSVNFCNIQNPWGKGYWKLNTDILKDECYIKGIGELIDETVNNYSDVLSSKQLWEFLKKRVKEQSITYSIARNKKKRCNIIELEMKINQLDSMMANINARTEHYSILNAKRQEYKVDLDLCNLESAKGAQVRARAEYIENGEKSTKYFLNLEKKRQSENCIQSMKNDNKRCENDEEILQGANNFFKKLYTSTNVPSQQIDNFLNDIHIDNVLTNEEQEECEGLITVAECEQAIVAMKKNKSPGLDGLPLEFYITFWDKIKHMLVDSYNLSFDENELTSSQRQSVMALIYKKGDKELIENYRPIS